MKCTWLILTCFALYTQLPAQQAEYSTTLTIVGSHHYERNAIGYATTIYFIDDPTQCDPLRGYIPVPDQVKHYREALLASGFDVSGFQMKETLEKPPYVNREYKLVSSNPEQIEKAVLMAAMMGANPGGTTTIYQKHTLEDQDALALDALRDALNKAEGIADHLDMKVAKVINIDDDTRVASIFDPSKPKEYQFSPELESLFAELEEVLGGRGLYTLRVTFGLEK